MLLSNPARPQPRLSMWGRGRATVLIDFALIFSLALGLRLHGLGAKPLWIDEVVTRSRVALPFGKLIADSFSHHHLPTYFLLLAEFSPGGNPWLLRLPSAIAGALAAAFAMLVGRKLAGSAGAARLGGLMSGLLLATAPVMVQFGQDARPYALELASIMLSLWGLVALAGDADAAAGPWRRGLSAWSGLLFGLLGALLLIGDALPFLFVANLSAWPIARGLTGGARRRFLIRWIGGQAALLLAIAPLYIVMSRSTPDHFMGAFDWVPPLSAIRAWRVAADVYLLRIANIASLHLLPVGLPALGFAVPLFAIAGFLVLRGQSAARSAIALAVVALPAMLILSEPARPLWLPRYLLWSGAALLVLAGVGAAWLARRRAVAALAAAAALLLANLLPFYRAETVPRWDLAAAALAPALASGAYVYLDDHGAPMMLRAYLQGGDTALPDDRVVFDIGDSEARLRAGDPIVAVHGYTGQGLTSRMSAFRTRVAPLGTPSAEARMGRGIMLIRFDPSPVRVSSPVEAEARSNP